MRAFPISHSNWPLAESWRRAGEEVRKSGRRRQYQEMRSPVDGVVPQSAVTIVGGVVQPAQPLMVIVPCPAQQARDLASCNGAIEVEAFVQIKDIGFIKTGKRRIIQYLLSPITQVMDEAARER